jgi:hypothetical protein
VPSLRESLQAPDPAILEPTTGSQQRVFRRRGDEDLIRFRTREDASSHMDGRAMELATGGLHLAEVDRTWPWLGPLLGAIRLSGDPFGSDQGICNRSAALAGTSRPSQIRATRFANAMIVRIGGLPSDLGKSEASAT